MIGGPPGPCRLCGGAQIALFTSYVCAADCTNVPNAVRISGRPAEWGWSPLYPLARVLAEGGVITLMEPDEVAAALGKTGRPGCVCAPVVALSILAVRLLNISPARSARGGWNSCGNNTICRIPHGLVVTPIYTRTAAAHERP